MTFGKTALRCWLPAAALLLALLCPLPVAAARAGTAIPVSVRTDGAAADAVHRAGGGKWIGVCGELAADTSLTAKLLAAGADELSVSPPYIAEIKEKIRSSV